MDGAFYHTGLGMLFQILLPLPAFYLALVVLFGKKGGDGLVAYYISAIYVSLAILAPTVFLGICALWTHMPSVKPFVAWMIGYYGVSNLWPCFMLSLPYLMY